MTTLASRIIDFFNSVDDPYEIRYRIKDDPNFGSAPASGYGISLSTAQAIIAKKDALFNLTPPEEFTTIGQIFNVAGVGKITEHNILYSFSESQRAWTASADGEQVGTLKDVRVGGLQIYDGALSVMSFVDDPKEVSKFGSLDDPNGALC